jgi:tRNA A-37 threonylcarbamoyl transferase component Bud32
MQRRNRDSEDTTPKVKRRAASEDTTLQVVKLSTRKEIENLYKVANKTGAKLGKGKSNVVFDISNCCVLKKSLNEMTVKSAELSVHEKKLLDKLPENTVPRVIWMTPDGIIMEKVKGKDLQKLIPQKKAENRFEELEAMGEPLVASLKNLYQSRVVHNDLHSGNIMMAEKDGKSHAVLIDFELGLDADELTSSAYPNASQNFDIMHLCDALTLLVSLICDGYLPRAVLKYVQDCWIELRNKYAPLNSAQLQTFAQNLSKQFSGAKMLRRFLNEFDIDAICDWNIIENALLPRSNDFEGYLLEGRPSLSKLLHESVLSNSEKSFVQF